MKSYKFNFNKKAYDNPYYDLFIDDECDSMVNRILERDNSYFSDATQEIADYAVHIYNCDVLKMMSNINMQEFIDRAITEFDLRIKDEEGFNFIIRAGQHGEFLFYEEQLHANADIVAQNALIRYVNDMTVKSNIYYDSKEIESFIESYIEGISINTDDRLDSIIADFESELLSEFDIEIMEVTK